MGARKKKKPAEGLAGALEWVKVAPKLPAAVDPKKLPVLEPIGAEMTVSVLRALASAKSGADLAKLLHAETTPESRDALGLALLEIWREKDFHGRLGWIMDAVVALGGDRSVLALAAEIASWPSQGETGRKRAIAAAPVLANADTDAAILALMGLRQSAVAPSVLEATIEALDLVVDRRNTTLSELFDAVTPTLGLDASGTRTFAHAGRTFTVVFDDHFEPRVRDADESELEGVPEWTAIAARLREAVKVQTFRLEQDMIAGRRWSVEDWTRHLHDHPLLVSFTRRLVWGAWDGEKLAVAFRTAEDKTLLSRDDVVTLPKGAWIGLVHPLHLDEKTRAEWAQHLADYEIIQPFSQLGRAVHRLEDSERAGTKLARFATTKFKSGVIRDVLVKKGWARDSDYLRKEYERRFYTDKVAAIATMDPGVYAGAATYDTFDQTIASIEFRALKGRGKSKEPMPLAEVPPIALSEAIQDFLDILVAQSE